VSVGVEDHFDADDESDATRRTICNRMSRRSNAQPVTTQSALSKARLEDDPSQANPTPVAPARTPSCGAVILDHLQQGT
jgi:hypothetical protein